jgi:hypothetical protein
MSGMALLDVMALDVALDVVAPIGAVGWMLWVGGGNVAWDGDPTWPKAGPPAAVTAVISATAPPS